MLQMLEYLKMEHMLHHIQVEQIGGLDQVIIIVIMERVLYLQLMNKK